ncbi:MAG: energy transducer TonB [Alphaproteobacteria bacterium]|nr:energy transducer TonB [Alphaproteobacteria bacterium]
MFFARSFDSQMTALVGALSLHAGLAAWAMMPSAPVVIPQQVIRVAMVAPAAPEQQVAQQQVQEVVEQPALPPKPEGLRKQAQKQPKQEPTKKLAERASKLNPTAGLQSPDAKETQSAITEPVFNAAYLNNPAPAYPALARNRGIEGRTMLRVAVSEKGEARDVAVLRSSGSEVLDGAALDAVKRWRFVPAKRGGEVVEAHVIVPVEFKLN